MTDAPLSSKQIAEEQTPANLEAALEALRGSSLSCVEKLGDEIRKLRRERDEANASYDQCGQFIEQQNAHIDRLTARVAELESYWTGSKLTGGHDVCHTCAAHLVAINDLRSLIRRMAMGGYNALAPHEKDEIAMIASSRPADETKD